MLELSTFLSRLRDAAGGQAWHTVTVIHAQGQIHAGGMSGAYRQSVEPRGGRSVTTYALGPANVAKGFDGHDAWQRGPTGEVLVQDSEAALQGACTEAWLNARAYLFPDLDETSMRILGERGDADGCYLALHAHPAGGQPVELWFDARTLLLDRTVQNFAGKDTTKRYADYRTVNGLMIAHRISSGHGDPRFDVVIELDHIVTVAKVDDAVFAKPVQVFDDVSFPGGGNSATMPIELHNNHVFMTVAVNGVSLRFMLDTGGVNLITPEAAQRAGLNIDGALEVRGPGKHSVGAGFARVECLLVADSVLFERQLLRVIPVPGFDEVEGTSFDGTLGHEVFQRLAVRIDYAQGTLTMCQSGALEERGEHLPLTFYAHLPAVDGVLDGVPGQFWLDTGNRNALTLWTPFVQAHRLEQRYDCSDTTVIGWGVGGCTHGTVARAGQLRLGAVPIDAPLLTIPQHGDGPTATRNVAGNIGGDLLRRFVLTIDYAQRAVWFAPNYAHGSAFLFDRAGMWINQVEDEFVVMTVLAGGPAEQAGLQVNDRITTGAAMTLDAMRAMLRDPSQHTPLSLILKRDGACREVALQLRDLVAPLWTGQM
ncbi:MAG: hypothetical protein ACJ8GW_05560 [Massilia sp.]